MDFGKFRFGSIAIDGVMYVHDVVIDRGKIRQRKKRPSKKFREEFGHTRVSVNEEIPWKCQRLVVGTGRYGSLPVMRRRRTQSARRTVPALGVRAEKLAPLHPSRGLTLSRRRQRRGPRFCLRGFGLAFLSVRVNR
jgi:hypothetical protein